MPAPSTLHSRFALALTFALATLVAFTSRANGRFPTANQLVIDSDDPEHFLLRATYGLLSSHDGGKSFGWICEDVLGEAGESDPAVAIFHGGELVSAAQDHLLVSADAGCSFTSAFADGTTDFPVDVSNDPADANTALAIARAGDGSGDVHLLEISGESDVARPLGASLGSDLFPLTLDAAPSLPRRIYVTALSTEPASVLLRSDDRGDGWKRFAIHPYERLQAYIAAVDPSNSARLYVRVLDEPNDHLLVSSDAGEHFSELATQPSKLLGVALSPDGSAIAVGGPGVPVQLASRDTLAFSAASAPFSLVACLKWTEAGLFACADAGADGFTLGVSTDNGQTFAPLFSAQDLTPLACDGASDVGARCPRVWPSVEATLSGGQGSIATAPPPPAPAPKAVSAGCALVAPRRGPVVAEYLSKIMYLLVGTACWRRRRSAPQRP